METRKMQKLSLDMPLLGMGLMRLPMKDGDIDYGEASKMVDEMYAAGVRYFDTAYVYGGGQSEKFAKYALTDRYPREAFCIASKLPTDIASTVEKAEEIFSESCSRMGVDYIDFYLLHGINGKSWDKLRLAGLDKFQRRLKEEGRIRYRGFSFHGSPDELLHILDEEPEWDFIQLQINYYDWYADTAKELYDIVETRNIPIIVMEPVRGSALHELGDDVRKMFTSVRPDDSNVKWAMRWIGSRPGVNVVLSGVSTLEHVRENITFFNPLEPMSEKEEETVKKVVETIQARPFIPCTGCNYCAGCPMNIDIRAAFRAMNDYTRLYDAGKAVWIYYESIHESARANNCIACGACAAKCPQHIDIPGELARSHKVLSDLHDSMK